MKSTGKNLQLGEKPVPVPLCSPQISHGLDLGSNPGLRGERPATDRLSHGTALRSLSVSTTSYLTRLKIIFNIMMTSMSSSCKCSLY
jgi:hypothetical protein